MKEMWKTGLLFITCVTLPCTIGFAFRKSSLGRINNSFRYSLEEGNESEDQLAKRMEMIKQIQKSFYIDEKPVKAPEKGSSLMKEVPLWRVQWTELPGFQNVLHVHVPHYTNMFLKIINSNSRPMYFGHLYLPGGSDNLDNPDYALVERSSAATIGTLMQICDYEQLNDGRLVLIVQGLERFRVVNAIRHHSPYSIADIEIVPDKELVDAHYGNADLDGATTGLVGAVHESFRLHPYENRYISLADCEAIQNTISLSPISSYDGTFRFASSMSNIFRNYDISEILRMEQALWIKLDEMIQLLQKVVETANSPAKGSMPIPTQILGLLPREPPEPWPSSFSLEHYATKLEIEKLLVGTYSKSPFVRADDLKDYSPLRRAQRLSYIVWTLTDTVVALEEDCISKQDVLEIKSTKERLKRAVERIHQISKALREILND